MAKTDLTREIEKALRYYAPRELGGIKINVFRGRTTAFEVPVECGTNEEERLDELRRAHSVPGVTEPKRKGGKKRPSALHKNSQSAVYPAGSFISALYK